MNTDELLKKVEHITFYNTSFRVYQGVIDDYIISIYPFVTNIDKLLKPIKNYTEQFWIYKKNIDYIPIIRFHHIDYNNNICNFDPCLLYEKVADDHTHC